MTETFEPLEALQKSAKQFREQAKHCRREAEASLRFADMADRRAEQFERAYLALVKANVDKD